MVRAHTAHGDQNGDAIWAHTAYGCQCVKIVLSDILAISVVFSTLHEVGREQGILTISVVFSTVHEVGREQGVLTSVLFSLLYMKQGESKAY